MRVFLLTCSLASALSSNVFAATHSEVRVGNYLREAPMLGFDGKINTFADFKRKPLINWTPCHSLTRL